MLCSRRLMADRLEKRGSRGSAGRVLTLSLVLGASVSIAGRAGAEVAPGPFAAAGEPEATLREPDRVPAGARSGDHRDTYVDTTGAERSVDQAYGESLDREEPHHVRSLFEMTLGLSAFATGYWVTRKTQAQDWDRPGVAERFNGEAWRFDNNPLVVNYFLHPIGGAATYGFARANHHTVLGSAGYTFLTTFLWEFGFEYREKVSVNDFIETPLPGIPLGEFLYKLGLYLDSADAPGFGTKVAQWTLGTGVRLDRAWDGREPRMPRARDHLGLTADIWHAFEVHAAAHAVETRDGREHGLYSGGFSGTLVSLPGFRRPGRFARFFSRADLASVSVSGEGSVHGGGAEVTADTLLVGYHEQALQGTLRPTAGHSATFGLSTAFRFLDSRSNGFREQLGLVHFPGPGVDWFAVGGPVQVELRARAHADFAGAGVLDYEEWKQAHPGEFGKHILRKEGYFYGWGGSTELSGRIQVGPFKLRGGLFYGRYRSQEGLNRWQERITIDVPAGSEFLEYDGSFQVEPLGLPVAVGVSTSLRRWNTWVGETTQYARALSWGGELTVRF